MFEKCRRTASESTSPVRRNGFLGAIGVARNVIRNTYPTGHSLERAVEEVRSTEVTLGHIGVGLKADLDRAAAHHEEYDEFTVICTNQKAR